MRKNKIIIFILCEEVAAYSMKGFKKLFPSCENRGSIYIKSKLTRIVIFFMNSCSEINLLVDWIILMV